MILYASYFLIGSWPELVKRRAAIKMFLKIAMQCNAIHSEPRVNPYLKDMVKKIHTHKSFNYIVAAAILTFIAMAYKPLQLSLKHCSRPPSEKHK